MKEWQFHLLFIVYYVFMALFIHLVFTVFLFDWYIVRDTGRKVEDPDMLESIRLTIINNLLQYHPVCMLCKYFSEFLIQLFSMRSFLVTSNFYYNHEFSL